MKSTNLNAFLSRSNYISDVFWVQNPCIFVDFHDFDDFCSGPVQDFSQNDQVLERSYCVFAIFTRFQFSDPLWERSKSVFAKFIANVMWFSGFPAIFDEIHEFEHIFAAF